MTNHPTSISEEIAEVSGTEGSSYGLQIREQQGEAGVGRCRVVTR